MTSTITPTTSIATVTLEVPDAAAATAFYAAAFDLGDRLSVRQSDAATSGFRGFSLSLVVPQPSTVDSFVGAALEAGATEVKPVKKSFWGYGGVVRAPDGAIWKVATSSKKEQGAGARQIDDVVLLLGVDDVKASKRFYVEHGLKVDKSFGGKYCQFEPADGAITLALYGRSALAKDVGVDPAGRGSHGLVIGGSTGAFTDPDGFSWQAARA